MNIRYIRVPVANVWRQPNQVREVDRPSLSDSPDWEQWLHGMSLEERKDLVGRLESQLLYGEPVIVMKEVNGWVKGVIPDQYTPKDGRGYPGWIPANQLTFDPQYHRAWEEKPLAYVTADETRLNPEGENKSLNISFMTKLPRVGESDGKAIVLLPDSNTGRVPLKDVTIARQLPISGGLQRIANARRFLGLPYLWAGMSSRGFDCSGFMYRIFEAGGIRIPRDADIQARYGTKVSRQGLEPGDLVFFAHEQGRGRIHHVGMYIGEDRFIHSPNTGNPVRVNRMTDKPYCEEFCGGSRYHGTEIFDDENRNHLR
ncbi:C40 family peptidase [Paludifilum halophilum]|uniref:NlpC/P60 domain-containing protein n=1 Tax=Paludifilum halophilum TaxID=1642702 RepID=A0A235B5Y3_9BACL|nr:NlpC/P60 family protein [Paludifilum halophilum]OYD07716.1 hypothetical protein CHM34_09585 [Paludifilum halophilum]